MELWEHEPLDPAMPEADPGFSVTYNPDIPGQYGRVTLNLLHSLAQSRVVNSPDLRTL